MYSSVLPCIFSPSMKKKKRNIIGDVCNLLVNQVMIQLFLQCKEVGGVIQGEITSTSPDDIAKQILVS